MKRKPLKISWKSWCLHKLAVRDYSENEMKQAIAKRALESEQEVDPKPIVKELVEEGLIDDERYIKNQISIATKGNQIKGPLEIKRKLENKGGIPSELIDQYICESDQSWLKLAFKVREQTLTAKGHSSAKSQEIPIKLHSSIKQKLYRRGFTGDQIQCAMTGLIPKYEKTAPLPHGNIQIQVEKQILSGKGPKAIVYQLKQKGAEESLIMEALDSVDTDWVKQAKLLIEKRYGIGKRLTMKERKKQSDFLARRGFYTDQIRAALSD